MAPSRPSSWQRRYPPLLTVALAVALVALVMPSALRLPQSNPREVPEFAPVPGQQKAGNAGASFDGLGADGNLDGGTTAGPAAESPPTPPPLLGQGRNPVSKQCVGNPPRQTEDKLSPPCVAYFKGDNGGATATGVTRDEVTVVVYLGNNVLSEEAYQGNAVGCGQLVDLGTTRRTDEQTLIWRAYARYFNDRYQTYGRYIRVWLQTAACVNPPTSVTRRTDAQAAWQRLRPFAVLAGGDPGGAAGNPPYLEVLNQHGVVGFLSPLDLPQPQSYFRRYPGLLWSYQANLELTAHRYAKWVCQQAVPFDASFSGNALENDNPRVFGHIYAETPAFPEISRNAKLIAEDVKRCGGSIKVTRTVSAALADDAASRGDTKPNQEIALAMAEFKRQGVTTVLWTGLMSATATQDAASIGYHPEWLVEGLLRIDTNAVAALTMNQAEWRNAWVLGEATYVSNYDQAECTLAAQSADPNVRGLGARADNCARMYVSLRLLFTGIQVAGPRLSTRSMDEGFHAIPGVPSTDPSVPACFFDPGEYTCVKDAVAQWWDPSGPAKYSGNPGCYRMPERGRRFLLDEWPRRQIDDLRRPNDLCNEYT